MSQQPEQVDITPPGATTSQSNPGDATSAVRRRQIAPESIARLTKANKRLEKLLSERLGTDFFGTISLEVIFAEGQVAQVNVYGVEKIR